MFLYTHEAISHVGSYGAFVAFVNNLAASMNAAFAASGVAGSVRVVDYRLQEGVSPLSDIDVFRGEVGRMKTGAYPYVGLQSLRNRYSADVVVLFAKKGASSGVCGIIGGGMILLSGGLTFMVPHQTRRLMP